MRRAVLSGFLLLSLACGRTEANSDPTAGTAGGGAAGASTGGSGGTSGSAGTSPSGGVAGVCPSGLPGPELLPIETPKGWFCIDSTEVKNWHYADFVDTGPALDGQPEYCAFNQSYTSFGTETKKVPRDNYPYSGADYCDARAYCAWAGKRLCGGIGGGPVDYDAYADATQSEWYFACSAGGTRVYPYGNTYDEKRCGTKGHRAGAVFTCVGGFPGLYDMSGNAPEWDETCATWEGPDDACRIRSSGALAEQLRCQSVAEYGRRSSYAGIRCCADAVGSPE
jgi:formylglycine-generating enzyme required for sulfatase activity